MIVPCQKIALLMDQLWAWGKLPVFSLFQLPVFHSSFYEPCTKVRKSNSNRCDLWTTVASAARPTSSICSFTWSYLTDVVMTWLALWLPIAHCDVAIVIVWALGRPEWIRGGGIGNQVLGAAGRCAPVSNVHEGVCVCMFICLFVFLKRLLSV